jgi:hypothetical protein
MSSIITNCITNLTSKANYDSNCTTIKPFVSLVVSLFFMYSITFFVRPFALKSHVIHGENSKVKE